MAVILDHVYSTALPAGWSAAGNAAVSNGVLVGDGSGDWISTSDSAYQIANGSWTIGGWIYIDSVVERFGIVALSTIGSNANRLVLHVQPNGNLDAYIEGSGGANSVLQAAGVIEFGKWLRVKAVRDVDDWTLYVGDENSATVVASAKITRTIASAAAAQIGYSRVFGVNRSFDGAIFRSIIYSHADHSLSFMLDTLPPGVIPWAYDAAPTRTTVAPGQSVTINVATSGVADGTTLYWTESGTATGDDIDPSTGSFVINSNAGSFDIAVKPGAAAGRTIIVEIRTGSTSGTVVDTADAVTITLPAIAPDVTDADEGDTITYTVTGPDGTYGLKIGDGGTASASDVGWGDSYGDVTVTGGTGTAVLTVVEDLGTEGPETLVLELLDAPWPDNTVVLATADAVTINDTSTPTGLTITVVYGGAAYQVEGVWYITEGSDLTVTVNANQVLDELHYILSPWPNTDWSPAGSNFALTPDGLGGSAGSFTTTAVADSLTEDATEPYVVQIYADGNSEFLLTSGPTLNLLDTSTAATTWAITAVSNYQPDEGGTVNVSVEATNLLPDGSGTAYWTLTSDSTITGADIVGGEVSGSIAMAGTRFESTGGFAITLAADLLTEEGNLADSGTVTASGTATLTDTGKAWAVDQHAGRLVLITSGAGIGQRRLITANTADTLTLATDWDTAPAAADSYQIRVEFFRIELRTGAVDGTVVDTTDYIVIDDTSLTPPEFAVTPSATAVPEGGSVDFAVVANWFTGTTLYWTLTGTANGDDFVSGLSGSVAMAETAYQEKTGSVTVVLEYDESIEGVEYFTFQLRTGSTGGPVVATAGPITIIDEAYSIAPNKTSVVEGETVVFTVAALASDPGATLYWLITGSVAGSDFTVADLSGSITLSGGAGVISKTLADDAVNDGLDYFYVGLYRDSGHTELLAISPAVVVREASIDYDEFANTLGGTRVLLVEMEHSAGWVYFGNWPYVSLPDDANPNRSYDDVLQSAVNITTRIDGALTVGEVIVVNDGEFDSWLALDWAGYQIRFLEGRPEWSLDDFRLVARATNGGINTAEAGEIVFASVDSMAVFDAPLQTDFLADGRPVPFALGKPFNVSPALIDQPNHEYQVHEGAIVSVTPRDNGADVSSTDNLTIGTFELAANPQGNVAADVVTSVTSVAGAVALICTRYGQTADSATVGDLPAYEIGLFYDSQVSGLDALRHICQSIGGYPVRGADGEIEVYVMDAPAVTPDVELAYQSEIIDRGLRLVRMEEPARSVTLNYKRNWSPASRDSLAGILDSAPAFAETLTQPWSSVTVTNSVADHPLATDLVYDTYLVSGTDASAEAARLAALRAVRREVWEVECYMAMAQAQVGRTVRITYPAFGFEAGRNARIISVSRALSEGAVVLEVWL